MKFLIALTFLLIFFLLIFFGTALCVGLQIPAAITADDDSLIDECKTDYQLETETCQRSWGIDPVLITEHIMCLNGAISFYESCEGDERAEEKE